MLIYLGFTENTREFTNFFKKTDAKSPTKSEFIDWLGYLWHQRTTLFETVMVISRKINFANINTVLYLYTILDDVKAQSMPNNMNEGFCSKKITSFIS